MYIIDAPCSKCNSPMKVALIRGDFDKRGETTSGPESFNKEEIEIAIAQGALLREQYSNTAEESYIANTCGNCCAFVGNFYQFKDYYHPAEMGEYEWTQS
jgi:hypothetical protein